ncbi:molybdopterin/thiamine biosynthesis adenylyltransferase [Herbaspirillum sp. Sphag1AN]|uniref:HesA/MoeB/ThiF family protein n=1 Tax=unclassified Herbaspirillum TaxID=2624150 RepID=UPI001616E438|nr:MULTISPECIES: molybdopterin-synthase adenylyltransferase MoeB [unclassified Herbaspirillum]MBB3214726.1 molybdopterin/thiamine biosynthesis adenylyltransferase [Herbaspirillum sp. Sphag1AN]MBB3247922.1 molybdopterin/thiamine biosynthesis adenylyltransferase [Herbaspirillum sp. Sphag64]
MNDQQLLRYSRHILLDEIDIPGQERLLAAHALVIGSGGLGSPVALYLASAGIGKITLVDDDTVDLTNLQRQIMHTTQRVGMLKVASGREAMTQINPDVDVVTVAERVSEAQLAALVQGASVVLDCSDNFATRHAVNRACVHHGVPLVSGAAIRFDGQISVFDTRRKNAPCYACLFPPDQQFEEVQCSTMGVFSPLVGIIGTMQAAEALKLVAQVGEPLIGRLQILDARRMEWTTIQFQRNSACPVCGGTHL